MDPEALKEDDLMPFTEVTGILRRGEEANILHGRQNWKYEGVFNYIDLNYMSRFFRFFNINAASTAYIERIVPSYEDQDE